MRPPFQPLDPFPLERTLTNLSDTAIMLARLRLPHTTIRTAIVELDDVKLSVDNLKAIKHHAPTAEEVRLFPLTHAACAPVDVT